MEWFIALGVIGLSCWTGYQLVKRIGRKRSDVDQDQARMPF